MTDTETDTTDTEQPERDTPERLVPAWLAVLVLLLLVAVVAVGGYILRGLITGSSPQKAEIAKWQQKVEQNPTDVNARLSLGYAYQMDKQYDQALAIYREVIKADPRETGAYYNTGVIYSSLGLERQAEKAFWQVLDVNPTHALAAKALGEYYAAKHHYRSLIAAVRPAVQAQPQMADLQYLMGLAYENLGKKDWARARYTLALKYAPDMQDAREALARMGENPVPGTDETGNAPSDQPTEGSP